MKRHLLIIAICLLLGAVVNVAVAWGCSILAEFPPLSPTDTDEPQWPRNVPAHWPLIRNDREGTAFGFHFHRSTGRRIGRDDKGVRHTDFYTIEVFRVGWPSVALQWDNWIEMNLSRGSGGSATYRFDGHRPFTAWHVGLKPPDLLIPQSNDQWKRLPIRPTTWLAIATNTLFYAAILWLLIGGLFVLRRFLRLRRGLCLKCAYPMGESEVCTECGEVLARLA